MTIRLYPIMRTEMKRAIPLLPLHAFIACTGATLAFYCTLIEVAYNAVAFSHRRFRNLQKFQYFHLQNNSQQVFYLCNWK